MNKIVFSLSLLFFSFGLYSQPWTKYLSNKNQEPNFFEIQNAFYKWEKENNILDKVFLHKEEEELASWTLFKRWEYIWEGRADIHGLFGSPSNFKTNNLFSSRT